MIPEISWLRIGAALALVLGLVGVGAWLGHRATSDYYEPRLDAAQAQSAQFQSANTELRAAVKQQNDAVDGMIQRAQQREQEAAIEQRTAAEAATSYQLKAAAILASRPLGADECRAASQAFDDELRQERAHK
ncbi:MAG TPA: hypothetical protein VMA74_16980 [Dyella sp.]|uniref:hypothetical protein n=1 Tax=Dyella sp. TaxID=1869338 RepID=UPI002B64970C|nr:hypothetical protein [Dyella sp.]HUB91419.1 hypothetical protein [Dyella sp.]